MGVVLYSGTCTIPFTCRYRGMEQHVLADLSVTRALLGLHWAQELRYLDIVCLFSEHKEEKLVIFAGLKILEVKVEVHLHVGVRAMSCSLYRPS